MYQLLIMTLLFGLLSADLLSLVHRHAHCLRLKVHISGAQQGGIATGVGTALMVYPHVQLQVLCDDPELKHLSHNLARAGLELCISVRLLEPLTAQHSEDCYSDVRQKHIMLKLSREKMTAASLLVYLRASSSTVGADAGSNPRVTRGELVSHVSSTVLDIRGMQRATLALTHTQVRITHQRSNTHDALVTIANDDIMAKPACSASQSVMLYAGVPSGNGVSG